MDTIMTDTTMLEQDSQSPELDTNTVAPDNTVGTSEIFDGDTPVASPVGTDTEALSGEDLDTSVEEQEENEGLHTETREQKEFTPSDFVGKLPYMGKGMLAIFVVIGVIMAVTALLNKVFKK